jgi:hypothetical protein
MSKPDPKTGLVGRTFERTQGCWNCIHGNHEKARTLWSARRQVDLEEAAKVTLQSPMGEGDPTVVKIRRMVDEIDKGVARRILVACTGGGVNAQGDPVGDLVKSTYLCRKWSGAQGASVARAGEAPDPLPMELEEKN